MHTIVYLDECPHAAGARPHFQKQLVLSSYQAFPIKLVSAMLGAAGRRVCAMILAASGQNTSSILISRPCSTCSCFSPENFQGERACTVSLQPPFGCCFFRGSTCSAHAKIVRGRPERRAQFVSGALANLSYKLQYRECTRMLGRINSEREGTRN